MLSRSSLVLVLALTSACSKSKDDRKAAPAPAASGTPTTPAASASAPKQDLAPPTTAEMRGNVRVINLLLDKDGKPVTIDVWGRRTFTWAPIQLAKDVAYGTASEWYGVPKGMATVAVPAGAGVDTKELGFLFGPQSAEDEASSVLFMNKGAVSATSLPGKPFGTFNAPDAPASGKGFVYIVPWQLQAHEATLTPTYGGRSFFIGDGTGKCARQRVEDKGFAASVLGGTQGTQHDVAPGKASFSLHKFPASKGAECASPKLFDFSVDAADGKGVLVLLHTRDGKTIEALQLPLWK